VHSSGLRCRGRLAKYWQKAWDFCLRRFSGPVVTRVHTRHIVVNYGYTYPLNVRLYPLLNHAFVELVYQFFCLTGRPVTVVDVGAAVGDTALLILANCPEMTKTIICIEGDAEFFSYLKHNLSNVDGIKLIHATLSSAPGFSPSLVRWQGGTAAAIGPGHVPAITLDAILCNASQETIDVIKIDVDGFDGRVLAGARKLLERDKPGVIFEWHPICYQWTESSLLEPFHVLSECNYNLFLFFTKFGNFSHVMEGVDSATLERMSAFCLSEKMDCDLHYDVIALPTAAISSFLPLAEMKFAREMRSRF
jgi:FkbM family methyltransferase